MLINRVNGVVSCPVKHSTEDTCAVSSTLAFCHRPQQRLSVLKLHSTEEGTSSTLCTSACNLNAHFLTHWWDRGRGEGVGLKGQGWRECGAERTNIHLSLLLHECHLRQSRIKEYFLLCRIRAMIPSTVHAPSILNTSVDYYVSLLKLMTCVFQILELRGYLLTFTDFKKSRSVKCYSCCFTKISVGYLSENTFCSQLRLFISRTER